MGRLSLVVLATVCSLLLASSTIAQEEINAIQPQSSGFLERIMRDYVYPIREYDWRGMVRRFLNGVMDYIAPATKEPKAGFPAYGNQPQDDNGISRVVGSLVASMIFSETNQRPVESFKQGAEEKSQILLSKTAASEEHLEEKSSQSKSKRSTAMAQVPPSSRLLSLNNNITPNVAVHSWTYLGFLVAYSFISILGALVPIANLPSEPLDVRPELTMPHNHIQSTNFQIK